ncbi:MAG TPA: hypothetical protein PLX55_01645 [bacterium]|jgi:hypothetical protein|nr:hypothetical protein [bacterium]HOR57290.1 hypothetical protein [bacterium]HPL56326.1 hypothetical protein [bacterium]HPM27854.1 hypothetical protein [bacterium]
MKDYLKILIAVTVIVFICTLAINLFFNREFRLLEPSATAFLSGVIIAFVIRKV